MSFFLVVSLLWTVLSSVCGAPIQTLVKNNTPTAIIHYEYEPLEHHHPQPQFLYPPVRPVHTFHRSTLSQTIAFENNNNNNARINRNGSENSPQEVEEFLLEKLLSALQEYLNHRKLFKSALSPNSRPMSTSSHHYQQQQQQQHPQNNNNNNHNRNNNSRTRKKNNKDPTSYSLGSPIQTPDDDASDISFEQP